MQGLAWEMEVCGPNCATVRVAGQRRAVFLGLPAPYNATNHALRIQTTHYRCTCLMVVSDRCVALTMARLACGKYENGVRSFAIWVACVLCPFLMMPYSLGSLSC